MSRLDLARVLRVTVAAATTLAESVDLGAVLDAVATIAAAAGGGGPGC